ncbi:MAG: redoxin domain-containing protein [Candidatus Latescibacteria bacterium]|jgi:glutaredoxin-dependent peroxiredoxin|nr:redoxin domain-containing protein [Candidatus Latescibacterota bacterium]MBT4139501.1 redoxin domain-containing protein [Candidatus Latescibacterota bacterium]MBT5830482.1 redoxin domain-containing protein [Candidatus Latescibacterota bacterium]
MSLSVGDQAPGFTLKRKHADGLDDVSLSDYQGQKNVVILFFPLAYTSVCTDELCSVSQGLDAYDNLNAQVVGVSVDSPFAQEAWANANDITIPLLSDFNKEVSAAYDSQFEDLLGFKGVAKRSAFVIDKNGVVQFASVSDDPKELPDFAAIKACLEGLD